MTVGGGEAMSPLLLFCLAFVVSFASADLVPLRAPSVPLIVFDPYMSIWSPSDNLTDNATVHWSDLPMPLTGMLLIDKVPYRFMGLDTTGLSVAPMQQESVSVYPFRTVYSFHAAGVRAVVTFCTLALPSSLAWLGSPASFIGIEVSSIDGEDHAVSVYYDNTAEAAVASTDQEVTWDEVQDEHTDEQVVLRVGTVSQNITERQGDFVKIDWGYNYIGIDRVDGISYTIAESNATRKAFATGSSLPPIDGKKPRPCANDTVSLAFARDLGFVPASGDPAQTVVVFAYDDIRSINFFGDLMMPYWRIPSGAFNSSITSVIRALLSSYGALEKQCEQWDLALVDKFTSFAGDQFATVASLAFRQTTGALKVVYNDKKQEPWVFLKEISSDGDINTVDVIYPAAPFFLVFAPETLRLLIMPLLAYANNETNIPYNLSWAPHHLGTYPVCDVTSSGQEQMPMEESANLLLMLAALAKLQNCNTSYLDEYWALVTSWAVYLNEWLPDPGNQLCTDDFEGPSPHNVNLAAKGIMGLAAFSILQECRGEESSYTLAAAQSFAQYWQTFASDGNHYRLQYDLQNTWSLKYNLLFMYILDLTGIVFPPSVMSTELAYYETQRNEFGIPLDDRANFTKSDWQAWTGAMGTDEQHRRVFNDLFNFLDRSPTRVPFSDWYDTHTSEVVGFRARPVIGGMFARMAIMQASLGI